MQALLIIDMQMDMQHRIDRGFDCVNPAAGSRITALAEAFRSRGAPVIHIRHHDLDRASSMHRDAAGYPPMPCDSAAPGEAIFDKTTSSAFASTELAPWLRAQGIDDLMVTGAVAGFCVNSTVRAGCDLGFSMTVVEDAVLGFGLPHAGQTAQAIFDVTMALLAADFARMTTSAEVLSA